MKKTSFIPKSVIESSVLNQRFVDLLGGSILSGFRLTKGTSNYAVSLVRRLVSGSVGQRQVTR